MNKEDVKDIIKKQSKEEKIQLEDIPELDLYMDQVIQLFEKSFLQVKEMKRIKFLQKL